MKPALLTVCLLGSFPTNWCKRPSRPTNERPELSPLSTQNDARFWIVTNAESSVWLTFTLSHAMTLLFYSCAFNGCIENDRLPPLPPSVWALFFFLSFLLCISKNIPEPIGRQGGRNACELWKCDSLETDIGCRCLLSCLASRPFPLVLLLVFASCVGHLPLC